MADIVDRAQVASDFWTRRQLDALTRHSMRCARPSAHHRLECGELIPQARREAVPGVQFCVECQQYLDDGR
jgi:phage/conjugal plasmid C-4 type zinc finger TraR family protein